MARCKGLSAHSLFILIQGLALLPTFHHDAQTLADHQRRQVWTKLRRPGPRWRRKRNGSHRFGTHNFSPDYLRMIAVKGGIARSRKLTARERRESARHAATARWSRAKASETPGATRDLARSKINFQNRPVAYGRHVETARATDFRLW
jgi:hypothetical protein